MKMSNTLVTKHFYIYFIKTNYRERVNKKLKSLDSLHKKKKFLRKFNNPRHVNDLEDLCPISYKTYKSVLSEMNKRAIKDIIDGNHLTLNYNLGDLCIKNFKRTLKQREDGSIHSTVNWGDSKKRKQEIIDRGGTPLLGDNGGEPWHVYYTHPKIVRFSWWKLRVPNLMEEGAVKSHIYPLKSIEEYIFKSTKGNRALLYDMTVKQDNFDLI
jgi:hypothetical protein